MIDVWKKLLLFYQVYSDINDNSYIDAGGDQ